MQLINFLVHYNTSNVFRCDFDYRMRLLLPGFYVRMEFNKNMWRPDAFVEVNGSLEIFCGL